MTFDLHHPWKEVLDNQPKYQTIRLIYADWCFDISLCAMETAQRWMVRENKYPEALTQSWIWHRVTVAMVGSPGAADLPDEIFTKLARGFEFSNMRVYMTREEAEQDLAEALERLGQS